MTELKPNLVIPFEDMQRLFDMVVGSMDFSSGFLETDDVNLLRSIAERLGVDPMDATPGTFKAHYKHAFKLKSEETTRHWRNQLEARQRELEAINSSSPKARDAARVSIIRAQNLLTHQLKECAQCQASLDAWVHQGVENDTA